jgi:phosphate transport system substrate-binding protein
MKRTLFALALAALTVLAATAARAQTDITVNGSATMLPIMHKMVEAYGPLQPGVTVTVTGGGSGNGIKALIDDFADIAMSSRALKAGELELAKSRNVTVTAQAVAIDALCPVVNPANPVKGLSLAQLRDIFTGKIVNWREVGGEDKPIAVVSRDTSSGTFGAWRELVMGGGEVFPGAAMLPSSGAVLQEVARSRYAIGYEGFCYVTGAVRALDVDKVAGTLENARAGRYKLARTLWLFTRGDARPEVGRFVEFVLSPKGCDIVTAGGAAPVGKP